MKRIKFAHRSFQSKKPNSIEILCETDKSTKQNIQLMRINVFTKETNNKILSFFLQFGTIPRLSHPVIDFSISIDLINYSWIWQYKNGTFIWKWKSRIRLNFYVWIFGAVERLRFGNNSPVINSTPQFNIKFEYRV